MKVQELTKEELKAKIDYYESAGGSFGVLMANKCWIELSNRR